MRPRYYQNACRLRDGAIVLYTRSDRKKGLWQARLKIPGVTGYIFKSLKTANFNDAASQAEDLYYELRVEQKQGLDVKAAGNLKFKEFWRRFYAAHEASLSIHRQRLHQLMGKKYFTPYFGEERVNDVPDAFVERYWDWRINYHNPERRAASGDDSPIPANAVRVPSQKTLQMEAAMLRQIFRWGKRVGFVKREPWVKAAKVKHTPGIERRPTFSEAEWKTIYEHMRLWAKERHVVQRAKNGGALHKSGPHALHRFQREMLRNYVLFMANSGLRPNEARQLCWRDIRIETGNDGKPAVVVEVSPSTKTGARLVVCRDGTEHYLDRLRGLSTNTKPDDLVFCGRDGKAIENFNKSFRKLLADLKLLDDRWGKKRSVYSLRHFYCTQSLLSGVPIHILAKNMGTSISHIEKHYSHVLTLMQAKQLRTKGARRRGRFIPT